LRADPGVECVVDKSVDLTAWKDWLRLTTVAATGAVELESGSLAESRFFRARRKFFAVNGVAC
jgi:hypothetical protein